MKKKKKLFREVDKKLSRKNFIYQLLFNKKFQIFRNNILSIRYLELFTV